VYVGGGGFGSSFGGAVANHAKRSGEQPRNLAAISAAPSGWIDNTRGSDPTAIGVAPRAVQAISSAPLAVGQHMRYFADTPLALDQIKRTLSTEDRSFKIDGGEVSRDGQLLAEIEITLPGSDMFSDDVHGMLQRLQRVGAAQVMQRVGATQSVLAVQILDGTANAMELLGPLWNVLARLATGLWHVEGQGFYDQGQLIAQV
jgi:hypothetical protein